MSAAAGSGISTNKLSMSITGVPVSVEVLSFSFSKIPPLDAGSGQATGKREWKPIVVGMPWTKSTPSLYSFLHSKTLLDEVTFEYGYDWISLLDAQISSISSRSGGKLAVTFEYGDAESGRGASGHPLTDSMELERVAFTFQKIQTGSSGGKTFTDDWTL